jgi:hypothetical protein
MRTRLHRGASRKRVVRPTVATVVLLAVSAHGRTIVRVRLKVKRVSRRPRCGQNISARGGEGRCVCAQACGCMGLRSSARTAYALALRYGFGLPARPCEGVPTTRPRSASARASRPRARVKEIIAADYELIIPRGNFPPACPREGNSVTGLSGKSFP